MLDVKSSNSVVARNLRAYLDDKGLKQRSIAIKAGLTPQELNDMLNGRRLMRATDIARIIDAVDGLDANMLFRVI